jgi:RNase H domain-containing protein
VLMHTQQSRVMAWLPDGKHVRPYRQALLDIAAMDPGTVTRAHRAKHLDSLRAFLLHELPMLGAPDCLILASAQNARPIWKGLNNDQLGFDAIRFDRDGTLVNVAGQRGRMRLVRLRRSDRNETPEWYMPGARPGSSAAGLWRDPAISRVFYSTSDKLRSMKGSRHGKQTHPDEQYALPSLLEIIPAAVQPEDLDENSEASIWAYAIEQWRRTGYLAPEREMTLLPLPLHLAENMQEYARILAAQAFPDDEETDDDDDDDLGDFDLIQPMLL